tara:strand:- start:95 stop:775 length:681 start_codon:yes stop_codon:yes gene_type:complete
MKHTVLIKAKNPGKFNYAKFGTYTGRGGQKISLMNMDGEPSTGYEMFNAIVALDLNDDYDNRVHEFLQNHPLVRSGGFMIEDLSAVENQKAEESLAKADAVTAAATLSKKEIEDICHLIGLNGDWDDNIRKAKVIAYANDNPKRFLEVKNDADGPIKIFIRKCLAKDLFTRVNGVYKYGTTTIGLTEESTVVWVKENADIHALLKNELRGPKKRTKQIVELKEQAE